VSAAIAAERLLRQHLNRPGPRRPGDLVARLGAVQAQEYPYARWGLGLRLAGTPADASIRRAFDAGEILRTHVMRPTWHFVTARDIRWMLELTAPRVHRVMATYNRQLELDAPLLTRATVVMGRALERRFLTRTELGAELARAGLALDARRLAHAVMHAELEGVICSGPRRGTQFTYALVAERAPSAVRLTRDEAVATLTARYFGSHGPATIRDFVWWSGLTSADARRGLDMSRARSRVENGRVYWTVGRAPAAPRVPPPRVHLLPIYDELIVAYRDREAVPHPRVAAVSPTREPVIFQHAVVIGGQIAGTWRTARRGDGHAVRVVPLRPLTRADHRSIVEAVRRYERFMQVPVALTAAVS